MGVESLSPGSRIASVLATASRIARRPMVREGFRDAMPMAIGIAAWGLVAGVAMAKSGMGVVLAILMAVTVYAGSAQIAALPLIAAGAPMWVVWATAACVSLRFVAFSFHYRPYFAHLPRGRRILLSYFMGDTNFALFVRRFQAPVAEHAHVDYFLGSALTTYVVWQVSIITGIVAGHAIPAEWGIGFAGTMALLALTCTQLRSPSTSVAAVVAACAAVAAYGLPLRLNIVVAISSAVATVALVRHARSALKGTTA
ncbi:AzlC family ABC transporter permease [Ramlibacter sp. MMS24-I3-19]|uniref:AzlC family ABC transporter permease n=1 Tax=Ramlibacter sp. MMS24-I3-19 TaxID=3416606 RepID=UPI003D0051E7